MCTSSRSRLGLLNVCCAGILWGTGGLAVVVVREHALLSPLTISGYRTGMAASVLLIIVLARRRLTMVWALLSAEPARVAAVGLFTAAYQALYFVSVVLVGVTVSTVVSLGLAPLLLVARDSMAARSRPASTLPVCLALAGLLLVSGTGSPRHWSVTGAWCAGSRRVGNGLRRSDRARRAACQAHSTALCDNGDHCRRRCGAGAARTSSRRPGGHDRPDRPRDVGPPGCTYLRVGLRPALRRAAYDCKQCRGRSDVGRAGRRIPRATPHSPRSRTRSA